MKPDYFKRKIPFLIPLILIVIGMWYFIHENSAPKQKSPIHRMEQTSKPQADSHSRSDSPSQRSSGPDIAKMTKAQNVVTYVKSHGRLPNFYITKSEARKLGWHPEVGNLCEVLPGKAIGGDRFENREGKLPSKKGRKYYEADINYDCGNRGPDRLIYSNDGSIYVTTDHYSSFQKK